MANYKVTVKAIQWFKNGDHPDDGKETFVDSKGITHLREGKIVRYYRNPDDSGKRVCDECNTHMHNHGWIDRSTGYVVCPGDWVITGPREDIYTCKPHMFAKIYERAP